MDRTNAGAEGALSTKDSADKFPTLRDVERAHIELAIQRALGNMRQAAALLGISRSTMYNKAALYGLDFRGYRLNKE